MLVGILGKVLREFIIEVGKCFLLFKSSLSKVIWVVRIWGYISFCFFCGREFYNVVVYRV